MLKNGFVLDIDMFVFFDIIYGGSFIDFVGFIVFYRVVGIYGNVIWGISCGNGSFSV